MVVNDSSFETHLEKVKRLHKRIGRYLEKMTLQCSNNHLLDAVDTSIDAERYAEQMVKEMRQLPLMTGRPDAVPEVESIMAEEIPVEMGFTDRDWFFLRMPLLLPRKEHGSAAYIRGFLYPAMLRYFRNVHSSRRYQKCVVIFRHVYDRERPEREYRDHDNIELNMVIDTIAVFVMEDDAPLKCEHYYFSCSGKVECTEVYVIPQEDFDPGNQFKNVISERGEEACKLCNFP